MSGGTHMGGWRSPSVQVSTGPDSGHMGSPSNRQMDTTESIPVGCVPPAFVVLGVEYLWGGYTLHPLDTHSPGSPIPLDTLNPPNTLPP